MDTCHITFFFSRYKVLAAAREGGDIGLLITRVPKVLQERFLIRWLNKFGDFFILIGCIIKLCVLTFQPLIVIYRSGNFVYHQWGFTSIYWPLPYPFRSLSSRTQNNVFLFVGSTTLGTLIGCIMKLCVQTFQPLIRSTEWVILCIINRDLHQFIGHCLISLDPWASAHKVFITFSIRLLNNFGDFNWF